MNKSLVSISLLMTIALLATSQKERYSDNLETGSELIDFGYNYTLEKLNKHEFVYKKYYPDTKSLTHYITFYTPKLQIREGKYLEFYDDGRLVRKGNYRRNKKEGKWIDGEGEYGLYENNQRVGTWKKFDIDSNVIAKLNYENGQVQGEQIYYSTEGEEEYRAYYDKGELQSTTKDTSKRNEEAAFHTVVEEMPRFPGCEGESDESKRQECATRKMLEYIYGSINYPKIARENGIEGFALFQFIIDKDGSVTEVKTLWGLCDEIRTQCEELIKGMPKWIPGKQNDEAVRVQFTLPVKFKLE